MPIPLFLRKPQYEIVDSGSKLDAVAEEYGAHHREAGKKGNKAPAAMQPKPLLATSPRARAVEQKVRAIAGRVATALTPRRTSAALPARPRVTGRQILSRLSTARPGATAPAAAAAAVAAVMAVVIAVGIMSPSFYASPIKAPTAAGGIFRFLRSAARQAVASTPAERNAAWFAGLRHPVWAPGALVLRVAWGAAQVLFAAALFAVLTRAAAAPAVRRHGDARPSRFLPSPRIAAIGATCATLVIESVWGIFHRGLHSPAAGLAHSCVFAVAAIVAATQCGRTSAKAATAAMTAISAFAVCEVARHAAIYKMN